MKLLTRLRDPALQLPPPSVAELTWADEIKHAITDEEDENNGHLGVGAATVPDVAGLEFLDSCRRRIPDIHEEFPPHGLAYDDYTEEQDS